MDIKITTLCIVSTLIASALITGCIEDSELNIKTIPVESTVIYENGFKECITTEAGIFVRNCLELRKYDDQINNSDGLRFQSYSYTPSVNLTGFLEGRWMYVRKNGGGEREICDLNETIPDNFDLTCISNPLTDMVFHSGTNILDISQVTETKQGEGDWSHLTYDKTITFWGVVTDLNKIEVHQKTDDVWSDGVIVEGRDYIRYSLIRLEDTPSLLGHIIIEKFDFEGQSQLMDQYDVYGYLEKDQTITLSDINGDPLAVFGSGISTRNNEALVYDRVYGNAYDVDLFPGVEPYLFDGIGDDLFYVSTHHINQILRLRQFDYVQNDADGLEIDFLINRHQATFFERGDTIGNITLSF
ncbi:MAG: hypothetical protein GY714_13225 [Desulfobacterales bacterium]|nr:hypothetical protein [Desulfobacterales bacterium]